MKKSPFKLILSLLIVVGVIGSLAIWKNQRPKEVIIVTFETVEESAVPAPEELKTVTFTNGAVQTVSFTVRPKLGKNPAESDGEIKK